MRANKTKKILLSSFILSVLLHLIILSLGTIIIVFYPEVKKHPNLYIPSYAYTETSPPKASVATSARSTTSVTSATRHVETQLPEIEKANIEKSQVEPTSEEKTITTETKPVKRSSMMAASLNYMQQSQLEAMKGREEEDPILLIGDVNQTPDYLTRLIAKSLSAHFIYPKEEGMMGIRGRVLVRMTLTLSGEFTNIEMVQSSDNDHLDAAALYATNNAPKIIGVDRFLEAPKRFVIGFVFR